MHQYEVTTTWTGNRGRGTADYRGYARDHEITAPGRPPLAGSSDPTFRGDRARWNPEQLLVAALSSCHMLWYLHLCADAGIVVSAYVDDAHGTMQTDADGGGRFTEVVLRPHVTLERGDPAKAIALHGEAHRLCFIASSVSFPVEHEPETLVENGVQMRASA